MRRSAVDVSTAGHDAEVEIYPRMWHCWHQYEEGCGLHASMPFKCRC